jgi:phosphatidylglycerol:prolipoprotein diacylglycerol transferase
MYPFLLPEVFGYTLPLYDIMVAIGVFALLWYVQIRFERKEGYSRKEVTKLVFIILISLGAALFLSWFMDGIFHSIQAASRPGQTESFWQLFWEGLTGGHVEHSPDEQTFGTITFLGGLAGGLLSFWLLMKFVYKQSGAQIRKVLDVVIVGVVLAHAFGRIGCFFAGCCHGIPSELFGIAFPDGAYSSLTYGIGTKVIPTQLLESAFLFGLFFFLDRKTVLKGHEFPVYLLAYGVWRFALEFLRGDDRGAVFVLFQTQYNTYPTPSQFLSLFLIGFGIYLMSKEGLLPFRKQTKAT